MPGNTDANRVRVTTPFEELAVSASGWLAFTIPLSAFITNKMLASNTYFGIKALSQKDLGSPADLMYSLMVAIGTTLVNDPKWNKTDLNKVPPKKTSPNAPPPMSERDTVLEELKNTKKWDPVTGMPNAVTAFEVLVDDQGMPAGLRIHAIRVGALVGEVANDFAAWAGERIKAMLSFNTSTMAQQKKDAYVFRSAFTTDDEVRNCAKQFFVDRIDENEPITTTLSLKKCLHRTRDVVCEAQRNIANYTAGGTRIKFPHPSLIVPFVAGTFPQESILQPSYLYRTEIRATLDVPLLYDPNVATCGDPETLKKIDERATTMRAEEIDGRSARGSNESRDKTQDEMLRECSFIETWKHKIEIAVEAAPDQNKTKVRRRLGKHALEALLAFDRQTQFRNPALSSLAKFLRENPDVFVHMPPIAEGKTPLANFVMHLMTIVSAVLNGSHGQKQHMLLTCLVTALSSSLIINRAEQILMMFLSAPGLGKSTVFTWLVKVMMPEGMVEELTYESRLASTAGRDGDCLTTVHNETPTFLLDNSDQTRAGLFRDTVTRGCAVASTVVITDDGTREKVKTALTSHGAHLFASNDAFKNNKSGVADRIANVESDPESMVAREDVACLALTESPVTPAITREVALKFKKISAVVSVYHIMVSIGAIPPPSSKLLTNILMRIQDDLIKHASSNIRAEGARAFGRAKYVGRVFGSLNGATAVCCSELGQYFKNKYCPKGTITFELLEQIGMHATADAQVCMLTASMFSHTFCSSEIPRVAAALQKLKHVNRKDDAGREHDVVEDVRSADDLAKKVTAFTGLDHERVCEAIAVLKNRTISVSDKENVTVDTIRFLRWEPKAKGYQVERSIPSDVLMNKNESPIEIARKFMCTPNCLTRSLLVLRNVSIKVNDVRVLTPYLDTISIYNGRYKIRLARPQHITAYEHKALENLTGEASDKILVANTDEVYENDVDFHETDAQMLIFEYAKEQWESSVMSFGIIYLCERFRNEPQYITRYPHLSKPMLNDHYPDMPALEYATARIEDMKRVEEAKMIEAAQVDDEQIQQKFNTLTSSAPGMELQIVRANMPASAGNSGMQYIGLPPPKRSREYTDMNAVTQELKKMK